MNGGLDIEEAITVPCIIDHPTITVHAVKCYKALIDLGVTISLIRYSTYQHIDNRFKMSIQPTTAKLSTANSLPMTALGMIALHLRIADFKFTHSFVLCHKLPDTEIIFRMDIQKRFSISHASQREGKFFTCTKICEQKATIGVVKLTFKILPRHNGVVPIKDHRSSK